MQHSPDSTVSASTAQPVAGRTKTRFVVLTLLAIGTMINYLDRTVLGISAPSMTKEVGINAAMMGFVFSAVSWTYALSQIPGGIFLDRLGSRVTYMLALTFWSAFTLLQGLATGIKSLLLFRFALGVSEAPCFPVNNRVVATWFPQHERTRATGVYTVGEYRGLACFAPSLFWLEANFGWRVPFIVTPLVIGLIVARTGSFFYALAYVGAAALIGALPYIFIVGDVCRVEI